MHMGHFNWIYLHLQEPVLLPRQANTSDVNEQLGNQPGDISFNTNRQTSSALKSQPQRPMVF